MAQNIDYSSLCDEYVECKLTLAELAKKYHVNEAYIDEIVKEYIKRTHDISLLNIYYKALAIRRKLNKKKKEEENEKQEKLINEKQKQEELNEKKDLLNSFLDSKLNEQDFCIDNKMSVKYFEDVLVDVKNEDKALYYSVKYKFYTDYKDQIQKEYEDKLDEDSKEKLSMAQEIAQDFLKSKDDMITFCKSKDNMSQKYFDDCIMTLKDNDSKLYSIIKDKISDNIIDESDILHKTIIKIASFAKNGIVTNDERFRKFTMLDYYSKTNISFNNLMKFAQKYNMDIEYNILQEYADDNKKEMSQISLDDMLENLNDEIEKQKVIKTFEYIDNNGLPRIYGVFEEVNKKLESGKKLKIENERIDDLIKLEMQNKESNLDIVNHAYNTIEEGSINKNNKVINKDE